MRRAAKVDDNQADIVRTLRAMGASVQSLAAVGGGCPDLLVGFRGATEVLELKDGSKVPSARRLNEAQEAWHASWRGKPVHVVKNEREALCALGLDTIWK